jgi:hypothetical protein
MLVFIAFEGKDARFGALSQGILETKRVLTVPILGGRQGFLDHEPQKLSGRDPLVKKYHTSAGV